MIALLLILGTVGVYWKWLAAAVIAWYAVRWVRRAVEESRAAAAAEAAASGAIVARADEQHSQILRGDERGVWGAYPPAV